MKIPLKIIPFVTILFLFHINLCLAQPKSPIEVVEFFIKAYGTHLMDEIAEHTTPKFRDNKPKSVWVGDTWRTLNKLKYERLNSSLIDSKVKNDSAVVVSEGRIRILAGDTSQKEIFYLVKEGETWLIDELVVTDEEIDVDKMEL